MAAANSALAQQNSTITAQCLGLTIDKSKITLTQGNRAPPKVSVLRDHLLDYPELWLDVFVAGPPYEERQFAELFARARCKRATTVETADLVVLTGGPDHANTFSRHGKGPCPCRFPGKRKGNRQQTGSCRKATSGFRL